MATRSYIGMVNHDGTVSGVYCHWDGYPSYNGRMLIDHYKGNRRKVKRLIGYGDVSSLNIHIGRKHDFDNCPDHQCNFYGRDRGEEGTKFTRFRDINTFRDKTFDVSYHYLYDLDGKWKIWSGSKRKFVDLETYLKYE